MCQGRKPSVLSTGPNFSTRSGSGMFFDSAWKKKTVISGTEKQLFEPEGLLKMNTENTTGSSCNIILESIETADKGSERSNLQ